MKQLQNNFTTPEQSKRLMELGVPADSADCYYFDWKALFDGFIQRNILPDNVSYDEWINQPDTFNEVHIDRYIPCWPVGRLIEIYELCCLHEGVCGWEHRRYISREQSSNLAEDLICHIEGHKIMSEQFETYQLDFSKLEE